MSSMDRLHGLEVNFTYKIQNFINNLSLMSLCNFLCLQKIFVESVVKPNQKSYPWYHQKFRRVPTIDECYSDDFVCQFEADEQFKRDKMVDNDILNILRQRFEDCVLYEAPDHVEKCQPFKEYYKKAEENWFIKCKRHHIQLK